MRHCVDSFIRLVFGVSWHCLAELYLPRRLQVSWRHDNHYRFFLFGVNILNHALVHQTIPAHLSGFQLVSVHAYRSLLIFFESGDMFLSKDEVAVVHASRVVINNKQRPTHSPSIGKNLEFSITDISHKTDLMRYNMSSSQVLYVRNKVSRVSMNAHPNAIDKDLGCVGGA